MASIEARKLPSRLPGTSCRIREIRTAMLTVQLRPTLFLKLKIREPLLSLPNRLNSSNRPTKKLASRKISHLCGSLHGPKEKLLARQETIQSRQKPVHKLHLQPTFLWTTKVLGSLMMRKRASLSKSRQLSCRHLLGSLRASQIQCKTSLSSLQQITN